LWHITTAALVSALLVLVVGTQPAVARDLRSPDARDAAVQSVPPATADLRSPDARDAAVQSLPRVATDLRSPDAQDLALPRYRAPVPSDGGSGDLTWVYLTIGGVAVALLASGAATTRHRRRRVKRPVVAGDA
jgi:hypothetical protein